MTDVQNPLTQTLELVKKAQTGDRDALNRLFDRYYERVRRSVRARIGARMRTVLDSGDILQFTFAKAFQIFDRFEMRNEGSFIHWLCEIAVGQIHDENDKNEAKKRKPTGGIQSLDASPGDDDGDLHGMIPASHTGPVGKAERNENESAVDDCLDRLPDEHRKCIVLRDYEGLEWLEVAKELGKNTDSAARELHRRALLLLAKCLKSKGIAADPN